MRRRRGFAGLAPAGRQLSRDEWEIHADRKHVLVCPDVAAARLRARDTALIGRWAAGVVAGVDCRAVRGDGEGWRRTAVVLQEAEQGIGIRQVASRGEAARVATIEVVAER